MISSLRIVFIFLLITLAGCQSNPKKTIKYDQLDTVDIDSSSDRSTPKIQSKAGGIGPVPLNEDLQAKPVSNTSKLVGVFFGPGLYRCINQLSFYKALIQKGITPNIFSGVGIGAIIAAHLASGSTPEIIEWKLYKILNQSKNYKPFSLKWREFVQTILIDEFKDKNIQNLQRTLVISTYVKAENKIVNYKRGTLHDKLVANITLKSDKSIIQSTPIEWDFSKKEILNDLSADILIWLDVLSEKISFSGQADYLFGVYGKFKNQLNQQKNEKILEFYLKTDEMDLDDEENLPKVSRENYLAGLKAADSVIERLKIE